MGVFGQLLGATLNYVEAARKEMNELNRRGVDLYNQGYYYEALDCFNAALQFQPDNQTILHNKQDCIDAINKFE